MLSLLLIIQHILLVLWQHCFTGTENWERIDWEFCRSKLCLHQILRLLLESNRASKSLLEQLLENISFFSPIKLFRLKVTYVVEKISKLFELGYFSILWTGFTNHGPKIKNM